MFEVAISVVFVDNKMAPNPGKPLLNLRWPNLNSPVYTWILVGKWGQLIFRSNPWVAFLESPKAV